MPRPCDLISIGCQRWATRRHNGYWLCQRHYDQGLELEKRLEWERWMRAHASKHGGTRWLFTLRRPQPGIRYDHEGGGCWENAIRAGEDSSSVCQELLG